MKEYLDNLRKKYETPDFILNDPIKFPHIFGAKDVKNAELLGFIASIFAFGQRRVFMQKLEILFEITEHNPFNFILNFDKYEKKLDGFNYRFLKDTDIKEFFYLLSQKFKKGYTVGDIFYESKKRGAVFEGVYENFSTLKNVFLLPDPHKKGANKRLNMFLRWMVRNGPVDLGLWDFINKKELMIPLDTHSARVSRELGLLKRKQNDYLAAWELTEKLKEFDPNDPTGYDFALFGAGVNKLNSGVLS